jgi:hypothetical protein
VSITEPFDALILFFVSLKGPSAVVVFLIMLGYILKMVPRFPNRFIPCVNVLAGMALTPILVSWPQPGDMPPGVRWPEAAAWTTVFITGFLLACVAWISHAKVLRKIIDDKVPALQQAKTEETK